MRCFHDEQHYVDSAFYYRQHAMRLFDDARAADDHPITWRTPRAA